MAFRMRSSKFRHVYGEAHRKDRCYENIRLTRNAHDSNFCAVNPKYIAVVTESAGGGSFVVLPVDRTGRVDINAPRVCGHAGGVLDIKWSPFNDNIIASGSEDTTVKIWRIPDGGLLSNLTEWQVDLHGHGRRVGYIDWHPTADNIILSAGLDYKCIIWNVEQAEPVNVVDCHENIIQSISWNRDGSLFCTTCKDKTLRVIDPRVGTVVGESTGIFSGSRPSKSVFLGDTGKIFCTGFSSGGGVRETAIWDCRNMGTALTRTALDSSNGILLPYYDHDTKIVFLAGKGDGNINYYEVTTDRPYYHYLNTYGSSSPQRGLGMMPKRGCDPSRCEIARFYKLHAGRNFVEPISLIVPRKSNSFHEDIFLPTASTIPSLTADEWTSGQNRDPILISLKDHQVVNDPQTTLSNAVHSQDGALNQSAVITTYKAVQSSTCSTLTSADNKQPTKIPASLKNIKRLSTCDDIITLTPSIVEEKPASVEPGSDVQSSGEPAPSVTEDKTDKAFVNSKIAAFENRGNTNSNSSESGITSPARKKFEQRSWSTNQENPPDLIANGMRGNNSGEKTKGPDNFTVQNAAQYFEHKEIEIIDISKEVKDNRPEIVQTSKPTSLQKGSSAARLILGDLKEDHSESGKKIHVKKTWSPMKAPSNALWDDSSLPGTDPELRKAYFRQVEEIKCLNEQVSLKDKRIRQLEDEVNTLRKGILPTVPTGKQAESDC